MAKGDQNFAKQETARLGGQANTSTSNLQSSLGGQLNNMTSQFQAPYQNASIQQPQNYNEIMDNYRRFLGMAGTQPQMGSFNNNTTPSAGGPFKPMGNPYLGGDNTGINGKALANGQNQIDWGQNNPLGIAGGGYTGLGPGGMNTLGPNGQIIPGMGPSQNPTQPSAANPVADGNYQKFVMDLMGGTNSQDRLREIAPQLQSAGIKLSNPNAEGDLTKIILPDGTPVRMIGNGEGHPVWLPQPGQWGPGGVPLGGQQAVNNAMSGYNDFANTGGFSPQDIQDMRARSIAPIRGVYDNAQQELQRSKALNNGISPNFAAAQSQMARDQSNTASNAMQGTDASIAGLRQQGRLAGLGGLSQTGLGQQGLALQSQLGNRGLDLSGIQGMSGLYGTSPGAAGTYGNQYLQAGLGGAQNQIAMQQLLNNLNLGLIGATQTNATIPSTAQNVLRNISAVEGMIPGVGMSTRGFA